MKVTVDPRSGFCFGVSHAIELAEQELALHGTLFCLGDIVHNDGEVDRLQRMGLKIITHEEFRNLHDCRVLIRAHGEPPETYRLALENRIELIDGSCRIVLNLQQAVQKAGSEMVEKKGQVVIYGKPGHAEVVGLTGQTGHSAIVVGDEKDLEKIDFERPVRLFSQTTRDYGRFRYLAGVIEERMTIAGKGNPIDFKWNDSICRKVSNRAEQLRTFAAEHDVVVFVSGIKSSNGMILYQVCSDVNPRTYLVTCAEDVQPGWFRECVSVGVCGATSTPVWLMKNIAGEIEKLSI